MNNNDRNEAKECGGRREFMVKAGAAAGLLVLSLGGAKAANAGSPTGDDELVVKLTPESQLTKVGGSDVFDTKVGKVIVIRKAESSYAAFSAACTHKGGPLAFDAATGQIACPLHGSRFDAATGSVKKGPAEAGLAAYSTSTAVIVKVA